MKIALLGAGHIGQTIARLLHGCGDYRVTVHDRNAEALAQLASEGIATAVVDSDDRAALAAALCDFVYSGALAINQEGKSITEPAAVRAVMTKAVDDGLAQIARAALFAQ